MCNSTEIPAYYNVPHMLSDILKCEHQQLVSTSFPKFYVSYFHTFGKIN